ncbi:MAG TPA: LysM peptidoglycan-binding domain-containing protein [Candidatus Acidoferrum sp.]|nr:LysM peptidoglycan-binding domain-containing protein [Candidatus Acidoferrum sp.]
MRRKRPSLPGLFRASALASCAFGLVSLLAVPRSPAQDVAEAARQEQARKAAPSPNNQAANTQARAAASQPAGVASGQRHVYTNDDLKRAHILTPRDRAAVEARKKNAPAPNPQPSPALDAANGATESPDVAAGARNSPAGGAPQSLGEIARRYRAEKAAREQQMLAQKLQQRQPFRMNLPRAAHAAPNPVALPPLAPVRPLGQSHREPEPPSAVLRRDPFSRPRLGSEPRKNLRAAPPVNLGPAKNSPALEPPFGTKKAFLFPPVSEIRPVVVARPARHTPGPAISAGSLRPDELLPLERKQPGAPETLGAEFFVGAHSPVEPSATAGAFRPNPPAPVLRDSPPLRPSLGSFHAVPVHAGDSLWTLSRRYLGRGSRWHEWLAANPFVVDPARLQPGMTLVVPATGAAPMASPSTVTVRSGDSLWKLARAVFGHGAWWSCIASANPALRDANRLLPGQELLLPSSCAAIVPGQKQLQRPQ